MKKDSGLNRGQYIQKEFRVRKTHELSFAQAEFKMSRTQSIFESDPQEREKCGFFQETWGGEKLGRGCTVVEGRVWDPCGAGVSPDMPAVVPAEGVLGEQGAAQWVKDFK